MILGLYSCTLMLTSIGGVLTKVNANSSNIALEKEIDKGLIAYLDMDENYEENVSSIPLSFKGDGSVTYEDGVKGKALRFSKDATEATRLEFTGRQDLQFKEDEAFTIGVWVKVSGIDGNPVDPALLGTKDWYWGHNNGYTLAIRDDYFNFNTKSISKHLRYDNKFHTTFENQWHFVIMTQDEDGISNIYVDGKKGENQEVISTGSNNTASGILTIGGTFKGNYGCKDQVAFDELKIWNRVLEQDEIDYLYHYTGTPTINGSSVFDLSSGQDVEAVFKLESPGGVEGEVEWSCDNRNVSIEKVNETTINVIINSSIEEFITLTAKNNDQVFEKIIQIQKDFKPYLADLIGDNILTIDKKETKYYDYSLALYNVSNSPITNENVEWEINPKLEGISIEGSGQNIKLKVERSIKIPISIQLTAKCEDIKQTKKIEIINKGSLPERILNKAEYYLPFEDDLKDQNDHTIKKVGEHIEIINDGINSNGARFSKGSYLDFGLVDLSNSSIAFSIRSDSFTGVKDPCILANKNWDYWSGNGFTFAYSINTKGQFKNRLTYQNTSGKDFFVDYTDGRWNDIVLSFDTDNDKYLLYVDGKLQDSVVTTDFVENWQNGGFDGSTLKLGNDGTGEYYANSDINSEYSFTIDNFLITNELLNEEEVSMLHSLRKEGHSINIEAVASNSIASDSVYTVDVHIDEQQADLAKAISFDLKYDPDALELTDYKAYMNGTKIETKDYRNRIHFEYANENGLPSGNIINYIKTRIGKLQFRVADTEKEILSSISFENIKTYSGSNYTNQIYMYDVEGKSINYKVYPNKLYDFNKDGVIGAGDISLAPESLKEKVAKEAAIYPYKRVVSVTMDGGGNAWDENNAWYFQDTIGNAKGLENVRTNTYAMDLHNKEFATSYSAITVDPPISGHNYISMLTGQNWPELPKEYQYVNETATNFYWADFGKEESLYPSVFKAIKNQDPTRSLAMFSEWKAIEEGYIEPDAGVVSLSNKGGNVFDSSADYINNNPELFKKTAYMFLQSDVMDEHGHYNGYFIDSYYEKLKNYDEWWEELISALKNNDLYDDTLIISNADHGGHLYMTSSGGYLGTHGDFNRIEDCTIYFSVGGQTVNKGAKLEGGRTTDLAGIVLEGLRMNKPDSMNNTGVFDQSMFLDQENLKQNNRDIEKVVFTRDTNGKQMAAITIENLKNQITTADLVISIGEHTVKNINTDGNVLRKEIKDGCLYLTIALDKNSTKIADIQFDDIISKDVKIKEVMLGTAQGKEIYSDLTNTDDRLTVADKVLLNDAIKKAEELNQNDYTKDSWANLEKAKLIVEDNNATQEDINKVVDTLNQAIESLKLKKADYSKIDELLQKVEKLNQANYTKESWNVLQEAISAIVYDKDITKQAEVDVMAKVINDAINALVKNDDEGTTVDKLALQIAVDLANTVTEDDLNGVVGAVVKEFKAALANAQIVLTDERAAKEDVEAAFNRLADVMWMLEFKRADVEQLKAFINDQKLEDLLAKENEYIASTWAPFVEAYEAAKIIINDENEMDQDKVNAAYQELVKEFISLRLIPNKDKLSELIIKAEKLNVQIYTTASYALVSDTLKVAKAVLADDNATEEEILASYVTLNNAIKGLVVASKAEELIQQVDKDETKVDNDKVIEKANEVKTADSTAIALFGSMMLLSLAGICLFKKKEE